MTGMPLSAYPLDTETPRRLLLWNRLADRAMGKPAQPWDGSTLVSRSIIGGLCAKAIVYLAMLTALAITSGGGSLAQAKARPAVKPGSGASFRDCPNCPEMVVAPAGSFTMGSPAKEPDRQANEGPQRQVTMAKPFAAGKFAVTFAEWDACVAGGGCNGYKPDDKGWGRGDRPVINVNWDDAKAYIAWLSAKTGKPYRLLSEAEREYVTRANATTPYWWGDQIKPINANFDGGGGENGKKTAPVKSFEANSWGLYQVHGNVWEWVEDCWMDSFVSAPADGSAWTPEGCGLRVLRGGSWGSGASALRAASRTGYFARLRDDYTGFRVARALSP
jgi:formylglycine-generating enzyme required for sulfatase activity